MSWLSSVYRAGNKHTFWGSLRRCDKDIGHCTEVLVDVLRVAGGDGIYHTFSSCDRHHLNVGVADRVADSDDDSRVIDEHDQLGDKCREPHVDSNSFIYPKLADMVSDGNSICRARVDTLTELIWKCDRFRSS